MKLDISIKHTRKQHAMKTLKVLTARQVPVKILAAHNLPDDILHVRAAITIQSAYRTAIAIRKARLRKAIVEAGYMDARRMKPYKPWEITDVMGLGLHQGWIQLRKWDYINADFMKDFHYCRVRYTYDAKNKRLVISYP